MTGIAERFQSFGYRVIVVPEIATMVFGGGLTLANCSVAQITKIEVAMLRMQMQVEDQFLAAAAAHDVPTVF
jgi:hypothetical protein